MAFLNQLITFLHSMQCTLDWLSIIDLLPKTYLISEEIIHVNKSIIRSPLFNFPRRTSRGNKSVIVHNEVHPSEEIRSKLLKHYAYLPALSREFL